MLLSSLAPLAVFLAEAATATGAAPAEEKAPPVIDIDGTVLLQFAIFVLLYAILRKFLFVPYLKMRADRASHIHGAEKKAQELERKRDSLDADYQQRMQKARSGAEDERMRLQSEGRARESELLGQARTRAQERIAETQKKIAAQVAAAEDELEKQAEPLAHSIAHKLLGREV
jgi:F-type H+-transporting ATPase subunit b